MLVAFLPQSNPHSFAKIGLGAQACQFGGKFGGGFRILVITAHTAFPQCHMAHWELIV